MSITEEKRKKLDFPLYCITAANLSNGRSNFEVVRAMLEGGAKIIQYREKYADIRTRYEECLEIKKMCAEYGCTFIINDNIDIALLVRPDGVHIGQDDLPVKEVRKLVGEEMIIGLSTHSPEQARQAVADGADYIGVGPLFPTKTKDNVCDPVGLEYLEYVVNNIDLPYTAIGGIKEHNMDKPLGAGARCICLVSDITGAEDVKAKVETLLKKIGEYRK